MRVKAFTITVTLNTYSFRDNLGDILTLININKYHIYPMKLFLNFSSGFLAVSKAATEMTRLIFDVKFELQETGTFPSLRVGTWHP